MADVKVVDIDGEQWNIKDQVARDTLTEQKVKINNLQENLSIINNKMYVDRSKDISFTGSGYKWVKIGNIYPERSYAPNVFLIGTRRGGVYLLSCSRDGEGTYWQPVLIKFYDITNKISSVKAKEGFLYILSEVWNSISIQQLNNTPSQITLIEEDPPEDAIDITIIEK